MARKKPITNEEVIAKLVSSGQWTQSDLNYIEYVHAGYKTQMLKPDCVTPFSAIWRRRHPQWWYHRPEDIHSYMIPVDVYKKHVSKYRVMMPRGTQVRLRPKSTRMYDRSSAANDLGDTKDWGHLGIGSGKKYNGNKITEILEEQYNITSSSSTWAKQRAKALEQFIGNTQLLIGNPYYPSNLIHASQKVKWYKDRGVRRQTRWSNNEFQVRDFVTLTKLTGDGVLGTKKLINGFIKDIYVHFLYPKWVTKRESRYEVLFETGASGIFTYDYLKRVYDTDIEPDESLYECDHASDCSRKDCTHIKPHFNDHECDSVCFVNRGASCNAIYDYANFMDTTSGKALDCVEENDDV